MKNENKWVEIELEDEVEGVKLKGELRYWSKDWEVRLLEPFEGFACGHLMYAIPVKYVVENSPNPTVKEISILEQSREKLRELYFEKL